MKEGTITLHALVEEGTVGTPNSSQMGGSVPSPKGVHIYICILIYIYKCSCMYGPFFVVFQWARGYGFIFFSFKNPTCDSCEWAQTPTCYSSVATVSSQVELLSTCGCRKSNF